MAAASVLRVLQEGAEVRPDSLEDEPGGPQDGQVAPDLDPAGGQRRGGDPAPGHEGDSVVPVTRMVTAASAAVPAVTEMRPSPTRRVTGTEVAPDRSRVKTHTANVASRVARPASATGAGISMRAAARSKAASHSGLRNRANVSAGSRSGRSGETG